MASRIVVFGATGYTGRLVAAALVASGVKPVVAGRDPRRLESVAGELGGLSVAVADSASPDSVRRLIGSGEVLVSTVGPFLVHGDAAVAAAVDAGALYLDSAGEPPFVRRVFEEYGRRAEGRCGLVSAFGFDYVPGNLAGALALREAGPSARRVDMGYFVTGRRATGLSTGTLASAAGIMFEPSFAWRDGRIVAEPTARRVGTLVVGGRRREGMSVGGTEHFGLPRLFPQLREVNVYLGWLGPLTRALQAASAANQVLGRLPGTRPLLRAALAPLGWRTGQGPDEAHRRLSGCRVVAVARDAAGRPVAEVGLEGPNVYTFTAAMLAWGARRAAVGGLEGTGALGPVDAFGLDALEAGCAEAGLRRAQG